MSRIRSPRWSPINSLSPEGSRSQHETEVERKRARDRRSQQAMRDRNKWQIDNLTEQVKHYAQALEQSSEDLSILNTKVTELEEENEHLRVQNAALRLSLLGENSVMQVDFPFSLAMQQNPPWETPTNVLPPTCLSDQILQDFVESRRRRGSVSTEAGSPKQVLGYPKKPNLCSLLNPDERAADEISCMVGDIVRSYTEIETLPKQVAVHCNMWALLRWMVQLDQDSWGSLPLWLRPTSKQTKVPHPTWIDRIPWPSARDYLIDHQEISLDDYAAAYSSSFFVEWEYSPENVVVTTELPDGGKETVPNPIFEEHIRQLRNWNVGNSFRQKFPDIACLIDQDTKAS